MSVKTKVAAKTWYDPNADVLYLVSKKGEVAQSEEVSPGITVEYDDRGSIVGVEILRASKILAEKVVASLHAKQAGVLLQASPSVSAKAGSARSRKAI